MNSWPTSRWVLKVVSAVLATAIIAVGLGVLAGLAFVAFEIVFTTWQYRRDRRRLAEGRDPDVWSGWLR